MAARIETHTYLSRINDAVDRNVYINSITQIGVTNIYTITTNNTKWIGVGEAVNRTVTIGGINYLVKDIVANISFNIEVATGQIVPSAASFLISPLYFYKGTYIATNNELTQVPNSINKTPFLYFSEPSTDRNVNDELSSIDRFSECQLYAMMDANFEDWTNEQHYNYCISAMSNYFKEFIIAAKNVSFINDFTDDSSSENHVKWGVYQDNKGHTRNIFNENLSGKKLTITFPFAKQYGCEDNYVAPSSGSIDLVINFNNAEYFNQTITEDTTINIVYN